MIWVLNQFAQEQLAPWVKDDEVTDAVFRTMATISMEWPRIRLSEKVSGGRQRKAGRPRTKLDEPGQTPWKDLPFDVEEFFRRLREGGQNG